jgi:hypothetical protein
MTSFISPSVKSPFKTTLPIASLIIALLLSLRFKSFSFETKKAMVRNHSLFRTESAYEETETKKAMGDWKPPMALTSHSNDYVGTRQTSPSIFCHHHQLPFLILKTISA